MSNSPAGYQVLARRWRPQNFTELVGQDHVVRPLVNGLENDRLHHAFLFTGTRGVGKTTIARILAKALNCEQGVSATPCGECAACIAIAEGRFVDLIEVDAASKTGVDDMRDMLANVQYAPSSGRYKVYLVDEVHMLSTHSFNALLKTLEEPPEHVKFLFATTDPDNLPVTVLSRCLQFNLKHLSVDQIVAHLQQIVAADDIASEPEALQEIGRAAQGSVRDALSILDQAIADGAGALRADDVRQMLGTLERGQVQKLLRLAAQGDGAELMNAIDEIAAFGPDYGRILRDLAELVHRVAVAQRVPEALDGAADSGLVATLAEGVQPEVIQLYYDILVRGLRDLPYAPSARVGLEMTMLRILAFRPADAPPVDAPPPPDAVAVSSSAPARGSTAAPAAEGPTEAPPLAPTEWAARVGTLALSGPARELASNCELISDEGGKIVLRLDPRYSHFRTPGAEKKLSQGLSVSLGRAVRLIVEEQDGAVSTPAARRDREQREREAQAQRSVAQDPTIVALQETMGARILPNSTQPIDGESP